MLGLSQSNQGCVNIQEITSIIIPVTTVSSFLTVLYVQMLLSVQWVFLNQPIVSRKYPVENAFNSLHLLACLKLFCGCSSLLVS